MSLPAKPWRAPSHTHQVHLSAGRSSPEPGLGAARRKVGIRWALRGPQQPAAWGWARATEAARSDDAVASAPDVRQGLRVPCLVLPTVAQGTRGLAGPEESTRRQSPAQHCRTAGHCCRCYCYSSPHCCPHYFPATGPPTLPFSASGRHHGSGTIGLRGAAAWLGKSEMEGSAQTPD